MCYAYHPVRTTSGLIYKVPNKEFHKGLQSGRIVPASDGYHYAKDTVGVIIGNGGLVSMRWDLIPRNYMAGEKALTLAEVIKKKNSRAKNPATLRPWGFDSFNARVETVATLFSFREPWKEGKRCVLPLVRFKEKANMDGAPQEFKNRTWEIILKEPYYLGGIWDTWERGAERLDSCTVLTMDSAGHDKLRAIWHERHPLVLTEGQAAEWIDPKTTPARAMEMVKQFDAEKMTLQEATKKPT